MKKIACLSVITSILFVSCEKELDGRHLNPDGFSDAAIEYLYTQGAGNTINNDYFTFYSHVFGTLSVYTQTTAVSNGNDRASYYRVTDDKSRWGDYYETRMQELVEIDKIYNHKLSEEDKARYAPFIQTAKVLKAMNTAQATDFFGDMPYSQAWGARDALYGGVSNLTPAYDTQKDIYYAVLSDLEAAAAYLKTATLDPNIVLQTTVFPAQDIVFKGDLQKWYRLTNSLLLRYAMRISDVDETKAKEVLSKLTEADLILANADNAYTYKPNTAAPGDSGTGIWRALDEYNGARDNRIYVPEMMFGLMDGANDPRTKVFFQSATDYMTGKEFTADAPIIPFPASADDAKAVNIELGTALAIREKYGVLNSVTFRFNFKGLPNGVGITAADVNFLLAEAKLRNLISWGGTAESYYNQGIILSVQEFYGYYKANDNPTAVAVKNQAIVDADISDATLQAWIDASSYKYDASKALEQIATQKWMHTGVLQPFENWAEYRRLDFPILLPDMESGVQLNAQTAGAGKALAPVRLRYPATETSMNAANVPSGITAQDRVWWDVR